MFLFGRLLVIINLFIYFQRKAFEEEKAAFLSHQFNSLTPFRSDGSAARRRPVSASAASGISPAQQHKRSKAVCVNRREWQNVGCILIKF